MSKWNKLESERVESPVASAVIFRLRGALTDTTEAFAFLDDVRAEVRDARPLIVINLSQVDHLTSAGVGVLAAAFTSTWQKASKLCLVGASARAQQVLTVVGLWAQVPHAETEDQALAG